MRILALFASLLTAFAVIGCGGGGSGGGNKSGGGTNGVGGSLSIVQKEWKGAKLLGELPTDAKKPKAAIDGNGNAIVVWYQDYNFKRVVFAKRFTNKQWLSTERINDINYTAMYPDVACNSSGDTIVVWEQIINNAIHIYAREFNPQKGWSSAYLLEKAPNAYGLKIVMNGKGDAFVTWQRYGYIYAKEHIKYALGSSWGNTDTLDKNGKVENYSLAISDNGNAVAVWAEENSQGYNDIYAKVYTPNKGWHGITLLEKIDDKADRPVVAMDENGSAIALWHQLAAGNLNLYAKRYAPGVGWDSSSTLLEGDDGGVGYPRIVLNKKGDGVAIWLQLDTSANIDRVYAKRYIAGRGWDNKIVLISNDFNGNAGLAYVAMNNRGEAAVIWKQVADGGYHLYARRYTPSGGWEKSAVLLNSTTNEPIHAQIAINDRGDIITAWEEFDSDAGYRKVYANIYTDKE